MYTFFSIVFGLIWAVASFLLLFKVWDVLGPIVLGISKNHIVQAAALVITYIVIFGVPAWCWVKLFGGPAAGTARPRHDSAPAHPRPRRRAPSSWAMRRAGRTRFSAFEKSDLSNSESSRGKSTIFKISVDA